MRKLFLILLVITAGMNISQSVFSEIMCGELVSMADRLYADFGVNVKGAEKYDDIKNDSLSRSLIDCILPATEKNRVNAEYNYNDVYIRSL